MISVMRLTRPTFAMPLVVTSDPSSRDLPKDTLNAQLRRDANSLQGMEELCIGQTLVLPQSFGYASLLVHLPFNDETEVAPLQEHLLGRDLLQLRVPPQRFDRDVHSCLA